MVLSNLPSGTGYGGGPPLAPVTNISTLTAHGRVYVKWTDPEDIVTDSKPTSATWGGTLLIRKAGSIPASRKDGTIVLDNRVRNNYRDTYLCDNGLTDGVKYYYKFFPYTTRFTYTESTQNEFSAIPNIVAPGNVSGISVASAGNGKLAIKWTDPDPTVTSDGVTLATWASTKVVYKAGSYPTSPGDGTLAINSTTRNAYSSSPYIIPGLTNGTTYYVAFFPVSTEGAVNTDATNRTTGVPNRFPISSTPSQSGSLTYNGNTQSPTWSNYDLEKLTIGGTTSGINADTYTVTFTPKEDYCWADGTVDEKSVTWSIQRAVIENVPIQNGNLTYTGSTQTVAWSYYDTEKMNISGETFGIDAGSYTATFTPKTNYRWSDGTTTAKSVVWAIARETLSVPSQSGSLTYNGNVQRPIWSNYDSIKLTISGTVSGTDAGSYDVVFVPGKNHQWTDGSNSAKTVTWSIQRATISTVPTQNGSLTYNGNAQSPNWNNYDLSKMTLGGTTSSTNAGNFTAKFTPTINYKWSDGTITSKNATWNIAKAAGSLIISPTSIALNPSNPTGAITVTRAGDGTITAISSNTSVATVSVSGTTITVNNVNQAGGSATITVKVAAGTNHTAPSNKTCTVTTFFANIYGVSWDGTSTTKWARTDDAVGFTDPVPYVAYAGRYGSPFDGLQPWAGMVKSERTGGTMVAIPKFWYELKQNGASISIRIADKATAGFSVSPAHMDRGDGKGERDIVYVGRYHCGESNYKSVTGQKPKDFVSRPTARTAIHNLGNKNWQWDFATLFTIWLLYLVEFADWNSQKCIGAGCGSGSKVAMGYTDSMPYHTGTTKNSRTSRGQGTQYRNIEGLWDNVFDSVDGCYNDSKGFNIILNPNNFSDSSGGTSVGIPASGYSTAFTVTNKGGYPIFIPSAGSYNLEGDTYSCDTWYFDAYGPCVYVGADSGFSYGYGLFGVGYSNTSGEFSGRGSRLMELP